MTGRDESDPTLEAITSATPGAAVGVRATTELSDFILAGTVDAVLTETPAADIAERRADPTNLVGEDTPVYLPVLAFDASVWWVLTEDDGTIDRSDRLQDRPPARRYWSEPPDDSPHCSVSFRDDGRLGVSIPMPVFGGGRIKYYTPQDYGRLIRFRTGAMIDPQTLLADKERPPSM